LFGLPLISESWKAGEMFDAVRRAEQMAKIVCRGDDRKYSRFRPASFYGGIATADCVGCNLQYIFCWSYDSVVKPHLFGEFHSPEDVARRLLGITRKKGYRQVRISGGEPTLANLTGAEPSGFGLQLSALENLIRAGVATHAAVMVSFSPPENILALQQKLGLISRKLRDMEIEELVFFNPGVEERLKNAAVTYRTAYRQTTFRQPRCEQWAAQALPCGLHRRCQSGDRCDPDSTGQSSVRTLAASSPA
jgi:uncharacterized Fe-S cluster-containing radical SAM superfamily protein